MDWQALTNAGNTVWGVHAERQAGSTIGGEKRRPRSEWQIQVATHPPLITEAEADSILRQLEQGMQGRRLRESPLLLSGLLVGLDGQIWHADGGGGYRIGKGRRLAAGRIEPAVLSQLRVDLGSADTVALLRATMEALAAGGEPVDGRKMAGMERRASTLSAQIVRTIDLAAQIADPSPSLSFGTTTLNGINELET